MILQGRGGARLELAIVDYEFPAMTEDPHGFDMNWLVVDIEATDGVTTERFRGPHLLTTEVARLADWLEAVGNENRPAPISFTEPVLGFQGPDAESSAIRVYVNEHLPGSAQLDVQLHLSDGQARAAATELRQELKRLPYREATAARQP